jgi:uncharacterized protein YndB with AHSA1/START domain
MELRFQVQIRIQKPVAKVFDAVRDPAKLSAYFTNGGASAPMEEGTKVEWAFADNPDEARLAFPVRVKKVTANEEIAFEWEGAKGLTTLVEIRFEPIGDGDTVVRIRETGWRDTQDDLDSSYANCGGWMQMLCCLKAYVEYGINLRKGAYEGLYKASDHQ